MSRITINSNVASLSAQRRLGESTRSLESTFQKLSSGLRINRASDDAAGLAIASSLNADARVFSQAIRNFNDGVALLNVAEGALSELGSVVTRVRELAEQASNGTLSFQQRKALNQEAQALVDEYNRIVESSRFNNLSLLDGSIGTLRLQGGYGANGQISLSLGEELGRQVGTGTFGQQNNFDLSSYDNFDFGDVNKDGILDLVTVIASDESIGVSFGNADGTFSSRIVSDAGAGVTLSRNADINGDGNVDVLGHDADAGTLRVYLGDGAGSFSYSSSFVSGNLAGMELVDLNSDGFADVFSTTPGGSGNYQVFLSNGNGTFRSPQTGSLAGVDGSEAFTLRDIDSDGNLDFTISPGGGAYALNFFGRGDGTFETPLTVAAANGISNVSMGDYDNDGYLDFVYNNSDAEIVYRRNIGGRSFGAEQVIAEGGSFAFASIANLNGDSFADLMYTDLGNPGTFILREGNGDGTFGAESTVTTSASGLALGLVADINTDSVSDLIVLEISAQEIQIRVGIGRTENTLEQVRLYTKREALEVLDRTQGYLEMLGRERGQIGAFQSRLGTAVSNLQQSTESMKTAESRIRDADTAEETAALVRSQILQRAGVAVLSQANLLPELALRLLGTE